MAPSFWVCPLCEGLAVYDSPFGRGQCKFGEVVVPLTVVNDTTGHCVAPRRSELAAPPEPGWYLEVYVTLSLNGQDFGPTPPPEQALFTYYAPPQTDGASGILLVGARFAWLLGRQRWRPWWRRR